MNVLIIGGTGYLGGRIAREAKNADHSVSALVREGSDSSSLEALGIVIVRGDITKPETLPPAFAEKDVIVTSAIGYLSRKDGDSIASVDDIGNRNLADAALKAKIKRLVFMSILTANVPKHIPHLYQKFLIEEYCRDIGLPFVALRPGAFLDQELERRKSGFIEGTLETVVKPDVPVTYILADDVARCAAEALTVPGIEGQHIDLGLSEPTTPLLLAEELTRALRRKIEPRFTPFVSGNTDFDAFIAYMNTGQYVAQTSLQQKYFPPVPTLTDSVRRWLDSEEQKEASNGNH